MQTCKFFKSCFWFHFLVKVAKGKISGLLALNENPVNVETLGESQKEKTLKKDLWAQKVSKKNNGNENVT